MYSCVWFFFTPLNALRFIDIVAPYLSLFDANTPDAMIDHHLFIPLPIHGSLGCLQFLAPMNTAAINTDGLTFAFLGGQPPKLFSWLLLLTESSTLFILLRRMVQMTSPSRDPLSAKWGYLQISAGPLRFLGSTMVHSILCILEHLPPPPPDPHPPFGSHLKCFHHKLSRSQPLEVISPFAERCTSVDSTCLPL